MKHRAKQHPFRVTPLPPAPHLEETLLPVLLEYF